MDGNRWLAGQRPVLVVGRDPSLPAVNENGEVTLTKEQEVDAMYREAEMQAQVCGCEECMDWLA